MAAETETLTRSQHRPASQPPGLRVGICGWSHAAWRAGFYAGVPQRRWLAHCAERFTAIEVNATFYRFMKETAFERWREQTPDDFVFALKRHKLIIHNRRLGDVAEPLANVRRDFSRLGAKLAAVLWQLSAALEKDPGRLRAFAALLSDWSRVDHVMEFRDPTWFDDETAEILRVGGLANCLSDSPHWPLWEASTADPVYVRLHGHDRLYVSAYGAAGLRPWARGGSAAGWPKVGASTSTSTTPWKARRPRTRCASWTCWPRRRRAAEPRLQPPSGHIAERFVRFQDRRRTAIPATPARPSARRCAA